MATVAQSRARGRPPRSPDGGATPFPVRLTRAERATLEEHARVRGVSSSEFLRVLVREAASPKKNAEPPGDYVSARPHPSNTVELKSRWQPRHVFTLHLVPGRANGPVIAVRRRVLGEEDHVGDVEVPGGEMSFDFEKLETDGWTRGLGTIDHETRGAKLALELFDHVPTSDERAAWLQRRRIERAVLCAPPQWVWVASEGRSLGGPDVAVRCAANFNCGKRSRHDIRIDLPPSMRARSDAWREHLTVNLVELALAGRLDGPRARPYVVYLDKPNAEQLRADAVARARRIAEEEGFRTQWENFAGARNAGNRRPPEDGGAAAVRALGLDPDTATVDEIQAAFRRRVKDEHADRGGHTDMGELSRLRDAAREYVTART